jgi:NAD-dependent dihydropyrimidine dehydrogenase PreA subunit/nitroreductase
MMETQFAVAEETCSCCGLCVADCPAHVLEMWEGRPRVAAGMEDACYRCQHCFAICPGGAISIFGLDPEDSEALPGAGPEPGKLETLVKGRRSVRSYRDQDLDPALVRDRALPERMGRFAEFVRLWEEEGVDVLFRGAPHLLVASTPGDVVTPVPDCLIALSTFDLLAQANGLGTLWDGLATIAIQTLVPGARKTLGIPADHVVGYVMLFGLPAVHYARTAQRRPALIRRMA